MIKLITNNPFRILGVYSNSPKKDMLSNLNKMKAFTKVGKSVSFPLDLPSFLPPVTRDEASIATAQSAIERPADQIKHSLFWFMKDSSIDDIAFNHLTSGNMAQAKDIWSKKLCVSSLVNTMVCAMIENDATAIAINADNLFQNYSNDFCDAISDVVKLSSVQLTDLFVEALIAEGSINVMTLSGINGTSKDWQQVVNGYLVNPLKEKITAEIAEAKKASSPLAYYNAGIKLKESTKEPLSKLKELLGINDMEYQMIADKLAQAILQCGINYYNDTDDDDAPERAMVLQSYALSIAVGQMVKDRCKENVDILKRIGPGHKVQKELTRIAQQLKRFDAGSSSKYSGTTAALLASISGSHTLYEIESLIDNCKPDLASMRTKLGSNNDMYLKISSAVANTAINALVEVINKAQTMAQFSSDKSSLKSSVATAVAIMSKISSLDMSSKCRTYFNNNNSTLNHINSQLNPSGGCYIATMAYGDYDHPQVLVLRQFRDEYLSHRDWGKIFIKYYYKHSPKWVEHLKNHNKINGIIRKCLDIFVYILKTK